MACTLDNIRSGFIKNGIIDAESLRYPSYNGLFFTCKEPPRVEIYNHIRNMTPTIIKQFDEYGEADEVFLDSIDIPIDIGPNEEVVMRDTGWEHLRRVRYLNHAHLVEQRRADIRKHHAAELHTMEVENEKHREKINVNRDDVWKLLKSAN